VIDCDCSCDTDNDDRDDDDDDDNRYHDCTYTDMSEGKYASLIPTR
jgi:hypothetical protein